MLCQLCIVGPLWLENFRLSLYALDCFGAISQCMHHFVGMCDEGIGDAFVLELHSVGQAFTLGVFNMAIMCAIVFG